MALNRDDRFLLRFLFIGEGKQHEPAGDPEGMDWNDLLVKATHEGVAGAAFYYIEKRGFKDRVPPDIFKALQGAYFTNLKRYLSSLPEIKKVLSCLKDSFVSVIVLKGIALAEHLYPSAAMRGMSDVDLLVHKEDVAKANEALNRLGYSSVDSDALQALLNPPGYLASLEYHRHDVPSLPIHLHWHPINTSVPATVFAGKMNLERIWNRAVAVSVAEVDCHILCPEHLIIYLCEHALRIGHSFDRLILILDIHETLKTYERTLDWDFLIGETRDFGLERFVFIALTIVETYTGLGIPREVRDALRPKRLSFFERIFLTLQLRGQRIRGSSYLIYLAANKGLLNKSRFVFRTFFPPVSILRQRSRHRKRGHPARFFYSRVTEVIGHLFRTVIFSEKKR